MSYSINQHFIPSTMVYLNSANADTYGGDPLKRSWCYFLFKEPVVNNIPESYQVLVSINAAEIPCSFFVINENNREFIFNVQGITYTIILDLGNYTAYEMATDLNDQNIRDRPTDLPFTFRTEYDDVDNKFDFIFTNGFNDAGIQVFLLPPMRSPQFGLSGNALTTVMNNEGAKITSDCCIDLSGSRVIFIKILNINTPAYDSRTAQSGNILGRIPITAEPNGIIYWENTSGFKVKAPIKNISMFEVQLVDENDNLIDFRGVDWSFSLQFDVIGESPTEYRPDRPFM